MFKWICLGVAAVLGGVLIWIIADVRVQIGKSVETINHDLPQILDKTRESTDAMATLSKDVKQLRELVIGDGSPRDGNMVAYETEVLKLIEDSQGRIGVKKLLGTGLADPVSAKDWVTRERKAALWDLARSRSKADLLERIGHSAMTNRTWFIDTGEKNLMPLTEWVKTNHAASRELETASDGK